jgi:hypothetical protein
MAKEACEDWAFETLEIEKHRLLAEHRYMESMALHYLDDRLKPSAKDFDKLMDIELAIVGIRSRYGETELEA